MTTTIHPFTRAGFGPAPFRCTGMSVLKYQACHGAPIQPGTSCDYCGTGIMYAFWIVNADESRRFKVGCDCVAKTNADVEGFSAEKSKHDKTIRAERNKRARETRAAKREAEYKERQKAYAIEREARFNAFATEHGDVITFLSKHMGQPGFLGDMYAAIGRWGSLTEGQLKAVRASMARDAQRAADAAVSNYQGEVGKPVTVTLEILATRAHTFDGFPPRTSYWHLMRDDRGNVYTMRGVSIGDKGERITGTFTVKAHEEYKGTKQTVLQRPRKLETHPKAEPAPAADVEPEKTVRGITLDKHLADNAEAIEREAAVYAKAHDLTMDKAREEVRGEYTQGFMESWDEQRYECSDGSI